MMPGRIRENLNHRIQRPRELLQNVNFIEEEFRSLSNTNGREKSMLTAATFRLMNSKIVYKMSRELDEIKMDLNAQIQDIEAGIAETVSIISRIV